MQSSMSVSTLVTTLETVKIGMVHKIITQARCEDDKIIVTILTLINNFDVKWGTLDL